MSRRKWQAVVAGVGGQGVLFVTRALAAAVAKGAGDILISEVHGMAQRGGAVLSQLKAGSFASPLITPGPGRAGPGPGARRGGAQPELPGPRGAGW